MQRTTFIMLTLILTPTLTPTLLVPICATTKPTLKRLLRMPLQYLPNRISINKDNKRCPSSRQCTRLLSNITPIDLLQGHRSSLL
ncbi:hypothetical protein BDW71DRAFT_84275 [Aspergillus fruticulosus]